MRIYFLIVFSAAFFSQINGQQLSDYSVQTASFQDGLLEYSIGEIYVVEIINQMAKIEEYSNEVFVVPNSTKGKTELISQLDVESSFVIILDMSGRMIQEVTIENSSLDLSGLSSGMYLLVSPIQEFKGIKIIKE